ncbi:hypothetical protein QTJ16_000740 [Diplocarpon rosae]|uniref:UBC core domain-containing protein n=1 Tax=Diplocarpon rosae TaxID=946125 RepID=A0AAD9T5V5_9HELO|nr:hypothetical protein QTJ16_000740 [Diplocarpon rosae]
MPRKAFLSDIQAAIEQKITGISNIVKQDEDLLVTFVSASGHPIEIILTVQPDVASYPSESMFMAYTNTQGVPATAAAVLEDVVSCSFGVRLPVLISTFSRKIQMALAAGSREELLSTGDYDDIEMLDAGLKDVEEDQENGSSEEEEYYLEDDDDFGIGLLQQGSTSYSNDTRRVSQESASKINGRIRHDLRTAKFAGFNVGVLSGMKAESGSSILSLSARIAKLGLSEEAIQAWDLEPQQYIILLIRYSNGYKSFDDIDTESARSQDISFRVGVSNKYKCTLLEALAAFSDLAKDMSRSFHGETHQPTEEAKQPTTGFSNIFISSSLNEFINTQLISLVKIRASVGIGWDGARCYFSDRQGQMDVQSSELPSVYFEESNLQKDSSLPERIATDHLTDHQATMISFPLIAAQFTLRYLTRCTEFCLVCHDRLGEDFEALKPYVCDKPLCLYQYMSLGFGPSVEHEILTQPYVVDLLISFCYSSAYAQRIRDYPTGMSLVVPPVMGSGISNSSPIDDLAKTEIDIRFDQNRQEVTFDNLQSSPVRNGEWVVIKPADHRLTSEHYRVEDISLFPTIKLSSTPVTRNGGAANSLALTSIVVTPATTPPPANLLPATMTVYSRNFDDMTETEKAETIVMLIESLPSIRDLRTYLIHQSRNTEPNLKTWKDRISPAALGILRWIIASNRSCIVQVDKCPGQTNEELAMSKTRLDQRVTNIPENWVQFRFAQGSPDKEQRFLKALRDQQANFNAKYPTLFAFHGSPLQNWHSIIRTGLDFKETLHGRAYGHGVYHAMDQSISVGYAQANTTFWHGSELKIASAMSLNEIVNCPTQFTSHSPYLVVQHIDWIQCRYLFVQVSGTTAGNAETNSKIKRDATDEVEQDPTRPVTAIASKLIGIPLCAASVSRNFRVDATAVPANKRRKHDSANIQQIAEVAASDVENISDIEFLVSDHEGSLSKDKREGSEIVVLHSKALTDFIAGSLNQSSLPMLQPPLYATSTASKTLNRNLKDVLAIQRKTPLHELGWYINPELIGNIYQWIVELHSFDASLPLAKDMKAAGVTSIVLEIRFGKDYPFSPPFVRVIRPRFLPFQSGGGGHVTAGGAMCMELLTNTGWTSVSTIESVILQVRVEMMSLDRPARLESTRKLSQRDYGTAEAIEAYERSCKMHGWAIPPGFRDFANPLSESSG